MTVLVLQPDATAGLDTYILSATPTFNYGIGGLAAGTIGAVIYRGIIKFDLSGLPPGAIVNSAILSLRCNSEQDGTDRNTPVHRSLVAWFEGVKNGAAPDASQDGSTWNLRNANGSVAWIGGAGGAAGSDWAAVATDTTLITGINTFFDWDVTVDVQDWIEGVNSNHGWWVLGESGGSGDTYKTFNTSDTATPANRPYLTIDYTPITGASSGSATVTGTLSAAGNISGTSSGIATVEGELLQPGEISGVSSGLATVSGTLVATGYISGLAAGVAVVNGLLISEGSIAGSSSGSATVTGSLFGVRYGMGSAAGVATVTGLLQSTGQMFGQSNGSTTLSATGWAAALGIVSGVDCIIDPFLFITDGTLRNSGQLNRLDLLSKSSGFLLKEWRPAIAQYKDGGHWSDSPLGQGRRLARKVFGNAIEVYDLSGQTSQQDLMIAFIRELLAWQEAASDYWISDWAERPIYLGAKAARETNIRYAVIHMISIPELENPYAQPFFGRHDSGVEQLTLRVERGHWTSSPPGQYECVAISSMRSWTVSGWQTGL